MNKGKCQELTALTQERFDWKIKVRIIRIWRAATKAGELFKAFNIMLLDSKNNRIHAFVPTICADNLVDKVPLGKVCIIRNFTVQNYKVDDKFRVLRNDVTLIFSNETQIKELEHDDGTIANNAFDFYDHSELHELTKQNTYLADVVGIIKFRQTISDLVNRHGNPQKQSKFTITDGSSNIKVTFWDSFALKFEKQLLEVREEPIIIIIASARVGVWNDEVDLGNVAATEVLLNYNHYSVTHLRKMLSKPDFARKLYATDRKRKLEVVKISTLTALGPQYIETEVVVHVNIRYVEKRDKWFSTICTSCNKQVERDDEIWFCDSCNCEKPYPDKKFIISVVASDETGGIEILLGDQQVRAILGKRVVQIIKEAGGDESFPKELKKIGNKQYTVKLKVKDINVNNNIHIYSATNICTGFVEPEIETDNSTMQASSSSFHLDGISQINFESPMSTK